MDVRDDQRVSETKAAHPAMLLSEEPMSGTGLASITDSLETAIGDLQAAVENLGHHLNPVRVPAIEIPDPSTVRAADLPRSHAVERLGSLTERVWRIKEDVRKITQEVDL